jgi:hypothetical protein
MLRRIDRLTSSAGLPDAHRRRPGPRAFTLLETSFALVVIGVGVLAFIEANQAFLQNNGWSSRAATATFLANEIRELMRHNPRHDPVTGLYFTGTGAGAVLQGWGIEAGEVDIDDLDDVDDFDGLSFGADGNFEGPINATGEVIPETDVTGAIVMGPGERPVPLRGWTQRVVVEKINPDDFGDVVADAAFIAAGGGHPGRAVDRYPLRVTVIVEHTDPNTGTSQEITRVRWVVPE